MNKNHLAEFVDEMVKCDDHMTALGLEVAEFVDEMVKCDHMTALRLEGNSFGVEASGAIGDALSHHPEFEKAYWSDMFTGRLKNEIPNALELLGGGIIAAGAGLVELELSDNAFGPNGLRGLVTFLKSPSCYTLKELKLNNNGLGMFGGRMLSECLIECHANSCQAGHPLSLKVFVSGRNRLENEGAIALAKAFKTIGTLEEITMLQNFIQHDGVTAIADACRANTKLRLINLNDNTFTERGSKSMAKVLPELPNLEVINFGDCLVRTDGAKALANALSANNTKLKELYLNGNEIRTEAIDDLVDCVRNKTDLDTLDLNSNEFGSDGVERLQAMMEEGGAINALSSLSDDEGDDEDDDDDNVSTDTDGGDLCDRLQETKVTDSPSTHLDNQNGVPTATIISPTTVEEFLRAPSPISFTQLGPEGCKEFVQYVSTMTPDADTIINLFIQISQSAEPNNTSRMTDVYTCSDELLRRFFEHQDANTALLINTLLSYLGLIKHEDKKYVAPANIASTLLVLNHVIRQSFFPKNARSILLTFIDRPNSAFDKCQGERHILLQSLYT